ncbi:hypothetical protein [Phragmitibacter flavus]|nr:hypothetical protein [Phragmitibacter flavus]
MSMLPVAAFTGFLLMLHSQAMAEPPPHPLKAQQISVPPEGFETALPDAVTRLHLADNGWRLVMQFATLDKVGVFNLATATFDGFIDLPEPRSLIATGGSVIVIFRPDSRVLEVYETSSLRKIKSARLNIRGSLQTMAMGLKNAREITGLCMAGSGIAGTTNVQLSPVVIQLPTLELSYPELIDENQQTHDFIHTSAFEPLGLNMDESGKVAAIQTDRHNTSHLTLLRHLPGGKILITKEPYQADFPEPILGGQIIVTKGHLLLQQPDGEWLWKRPSESSPGNYSRIFGYSAVLERSDRGVNHAGFRVLALPHLTTLKSIKQSLESMRAFATVTSDVTLTAASAYSDRFACIAPGKRSMRIWELGLRESASDGHAIPGILFKRTLALPAGMSAKLESAPKGMKLDSSSMTLEWEPPPDLAKGKVIKVIILLTKSDGGKEYHIEEIVVP